MATWGDLERRIRSRSQDCLTEDELREFFRQYQQGENGQVKIPNHALKNCSTLKSVHIPMGQIAERKDELNMEDTIIVVCHHGIRSRMVAKFLDASGFIDVINLSGGVDSWSKEVDQSMPKYV